MGVDFFRASYADVKCPICATANPHFFQREWGQRGTRHIYGSRFICCFCQHSWVDTECLGTFTNYYERVTVTREELERAERQMPPLVERVMDELQRGRRWL